MIHGHLRETTQREAGMQVAVSYEGSQPWAMHRGPQRLPMCRTEREGGAFS
jgi:hypothetical protein